MSNEIAAGIPPKNSILLLSAYRAARLRLPNMAHEPRNTVYHREREREREREDKKWIGHVYVDISKCV